MPDRLPSLRSHPLAAAVAAAALAVFASPTTAQTQEDPSRAAAPPTTAEDEATDLDGIIVTGYADRQLLLDVETQTGSRLGLTARETPAIVDILSLRQIQELGARTNVEALNRAPGVTASLPATSPGIPTMRGFSFGGVGLFYDGARVGIPAIFTRATDSWLYERIEILKGPASVLFGEGALAGAINLLPKRAMLGASEVDVLASHGSFDTRRYAADVSVPLGDSLALRTVASYGRSDGYVDDAASEFFAGSVSARLQPSERLTVDLALDYSEDSYQVADLGTPLVPRAVARDPSGIVRTANGDVVDEALRKANFNVTDAVLDADTQWLRSHVDYALGESLRLRNELSRYHSDRRFINAEVFTYNRGTGLLDRTTGIVTHDIDYWIERPTLSGEFMLGAMRNRFAAGAEFSDLEFATRRYFARTTSVDPYAPVRGTFPGGVASLPPPNSQAQVRVASAFVEDALNLSPRWLLAAGARYDGIDFERTIDSTAGAATHIDRDYSALSWRLGTVYDLRPKTQAFAQYSSAVAPVANLLTLSLANARFDLTTGESVEGGIKSSFWGDRIDATLAAYLIRQDGIITRDPQDPTLSVQGGRQSSRGAELSLSAAVTSQLRIDGNYTVLDARFDELREAGGVNRAGNTPPRTPERVANLFAFYSFDLVPLTLSGGIRRAGRFYTDNANAIRVDGHTTLDAAIGYRLPFGELVLRGRNLTDAFYADYSDVSPNQFTLGAPRSVDLTLSVSF